jgi:hypothetical protein
MTYRRTPRRCAPFELHGKVIKTFAIRSIDPGSKRGLGCFHIVKVIGCGSPEDTDLTWVEIGLGNVKMRNDRDAIAMPTHHLAAFEWRNNCGVKLTGNLGRVARATAKHPSQSRH